LSVFPRKGWREEVERNVQVTGVRRWGELVIDREELRGLVSTGHSPQWAVAPMEEEDCFEARIQFTFFM